MVKFIYKIYIFYIFFLRDALEVMWKNRLGGRSRTPKCRGDIGAIRQDNGSMDQSGRGFRRESECSGETFRSHRYWASLGANGYNG